MKLLLTLLFTFFSAHASAQEKAPIRPGDHVAIIGNTFADQLRVHGYLESALLQHFKGQKNSISIRNLGWGGDMLSARDRPTNFPSEESTLKDHKTDVIVACFGMGESFNGETGLSAFRQNLEALIKSHQGKLYSGKSPVRLVLVSPIAYESLQKLTPNHSRRNEELKAYSQAIEAVALKAGIPSINLYETSRYLMEEAAGPNLTTNGIHLTNYGYWAISHHLSDQLLTTTPAPWQINIDLPSKTKSTGIGTSTGVTISQLTTTGSTITFKIKEDSAPSLAPPINGDLPPQLEATRDRLFVKNLPKGTYRLTIDGVTVTQATHEAWAQGVAIDSSPAHKEAEALRKAVNDKNQQFIYSWKALNQVHIVGERKNSPSGKALPAEIIAFDKLARQKEATLKKSTAPKTRTWTLAPVKP
ncbi:MAG: SGNH/GDSL hydrolase family protein [Akkermansiaceae bacterium]